jgi:hypothetical protein
MVEVARTALERVAGGPARDRSDLTVPGDYARHLTWPEEEEREGAATSAESAGSSDARRAWLDALAAAVREAAAGANPRALATVLTDRFFDHADRRRREPRPELAEAEAYVWDLGDQLAALLS